MTPETAVDIAVEAGFAVLPKPVEKLIESTDIDKQAKAVVKAKTDLVLTTTEIAVEEVIENKREKNETKSTQEEKSP